MLFAGCCCCGVVLDHLVVVHDGNVYLRQPATNGMNFRFFNVRPACYAMQCFANYGCFSLRSVLLITVLMPVSRLPLLTLSLSVCVSRFLCFVQSSSSMVWQTPAPAHAAFSLRFGDNASLHRFAGMLAKCLWERNNGMPMAKLKVCATMGDVRCCGWLVGWWFVLVHAIAWVGFSRDNKKK